MVIRSTFEYKLSAIILILSVLMMDYVLVLGDNSGGWFWIMLVTLGLLFVIARYYIAVGKTITFTEEGLVICVLFYKKQFKWSDIITIKTERYQGTLSYKGKYSEGIIISARGVNRPRWMGPIEYGMLFSPVSFVFICFSDLSSKEYAPYIVEKGAFLAALKDWNVRIDQ